MPDVGEKVEITSGGKIISHLNTVDLAPFRSTMDELAEYRLSMEVPRMKYLCLACEEEQKLNALSREEWSRLREATLHYIDSLRDSGHLILAEPLQSAATAVSVQVRGGHLSTTDGPFAETKEQLGGIFLIEARDLNEAIQIAAGWPSARIGTIEVRPLETGLREDGRYATVI